MNRTDEIFYKVTYASLLVLAAGIFTSLSFSALAHILMLPSGTYFLVKFFKENRPFKIKVSVISLAIMALFCMFSVLTNWQEMENPIQNLLKTKYFVFAILSYFSFNYFKKNYAKDKHWKVILNLFLISTSIATISGLIGLWSGFNPLKFKDACHPTRACGLYGMYMTYGYGISLFMVLVTGLTLYKERFKSYIIPWLLYAALFINGLGLIFSFARGAWLGFVIAVPFLLFKDHKRKFLIGSLVGALILGLSVAFVPKVQKVFLKRQGSNEQRIDFYQAAYYAFKENPILGLGYRNFEANSKAIKKKYDIGSQHFAGHAHNNALEHLASTGGLGLLAFIIFCLLWLKESYKEPIIISFVISFLVSGMVQYTFGDGENLFLILGIFSLF